MSRASEWLLPYLVNSLWQVPLLFAFGWLAARMARPLGANVEHRVWVATYLLQSLVPAASLLPGAWFTWSRHTDAVHGVASVTVSASGVAGSIYMPKHLLASLTTIYGIAILYFAARFIWRIMRLFSMRHSARPSELKQEAAAYLAHSLQYFRLTNVTVLTSDIIFSPVSFGFGFLCKLVLLPAAMSDDFTSTDLRTILAHECAHIYRKDFLNNLLYELVSLPVSYHPFCWAARERVTETREIVCDDLAAELTGRVDYAGSLLHLAGLLLQRTATSTNPAIGIFDARIFERRIMNLTRTSHPVQSWKHKTITAACVGLCLLTCGSAIALRIHTDPPTASVDQSKIAKADQPVKIAAGIMAGNKLTGVNPVYPEAAKRKKIQGTVVLSAVINKEGSVEQVMMKSGPEELGPPSIEAVRQWTYKPYLLNGERAAVQTIVNVTYSLSK